jgi:Flp pilus assembly protein TadG
LGAAAGNLRRGSMSIQLLVILIPVVFGLMGFAIDLGRLYMVKGELNQAANAMALAAATQLLGTSSSIDNATTAATASLNDGTGHAPRFNFGANVVGQSVGLLTSEVGEPAFFATAAGATGTDTGSSDQADGTTARHIQVNVTAEAPLLFWSLLSLGQSRKTLIAGRAVAGISAPVCTACGIEPLAVARQDTDASDDTDFGFVADTQYTFSFRCTGQQSTQVVGTIPYVVVQDVDFVSSEADAATLVLTANQQLYKIGAAGQIPSTNRLQSCLSVGKTATLWTDPDGVAISPVACQGQISPNAGVASFLCGAATRLSTTIPEACLSNVDLGGEVENMATAFAADTSVAFDETAYADYTGNGRRVITLPIVDSLDTLTILGFRQFLVTVTATADGAAGELPVTDTYGRFTAIYVGSKVPIKQGYIGDRFGTGCSIASGPGKVVLHQ